MNFGTYRSVRFGVLLASCMILLACSAQARIGLPDFTDLVEKSSPAVVNISTSQHLGSSEVDLGELPEDHPFRGFLDRYGGQPPGEQFDSESLGSGFIISADGVVLTNYHVVRGADEIVVRLSDRREFIAETVGYDESSDLAVLKIEAEGLPVARTGRSADLKVGEWVLAIGSPFGFEHSATAGIVSAKGRSLPQGNYVPFIQSDVAINPGNSGGPLFNLSGEVVGINSHIYSRTGGFMGVSFAIPIELALDVAEQLRSTGRVTRGWLGVLIQDVTRDLAESFGMDKPVGALVAEVVPGSPAARAGLEIGDVIIEYNGKEIGASAELPPLVGRTPIGERVPLRVVRDGKQRELGLTIAELPDQDERRLPARAPAAEPGGVDGRLGLRVEPLDPEQREGLGIEGGVLVTRVERGPAAAAGIMAGDVLAMLNHRRVNSVEDYREIVAALPGGRSVPVLVHREGMARFFALRLPSAGR